MDGGKGSWIHSKKSSELQPIAMTFQFIKGRHTQRNYKKYSSGEQKGLGKLWKMLRDTIQTNFI